MKIRNGFVSNSSSSSFVVGIGRVIDPSKVAQLFPRHRVVTFEDLYANSEYDVVVDIKKHLIKVESFQDSASIKYDPAQTNAQFLIINEASNEGDCGYECGCNEVASCVYDGIALPDGWYEDVYGIVATQLTPEAHGVADYTFSCGCGRNG